MAQSIRDQIMAAITTALDASGKPSGTDPNGNTIPLVVTRMRVQGLDDSLLPSCSIYPLKETAEWDEEDDAERHLLEVGLELRVRTTSSPLDQDLDPILNWTTGQMLADMKWGGLALATRELGVEWESATGESNYGRALHTWQIEFYTKQADPTSSPY